MFGDIDSANLKENPHEDFKKIGQYGFHSNDQIGKGNFSMVYRGIDRQTKSQVAVKIVQYSSLKSKISEKLLKNEVSLLRELKHPNIIQCLDILTSQKNCYIITEYCEGGDLERLLFNKKTFEENQISKILYGVYKGLLYLNEIQIIHRDFKIANIFLTADGTPKIGDFGFAVKASQPFKDIEIGSRIYMSPEGLLLREYGPKSEVWAFGLVIYELLHGQVPLSRCKTEQQLRSQVVISPRINPKISPELRNLISRCLTVDPKERICMKQIAQTPYMMKLINHLEGHSIPKQMVSTYHTSTSSHSSPLNQIKDIKFYDQGLAILQYCRLTHKTCEKAPSPLLSQWLLNLSWQLQKVRPQNGNPEKIEKFVATANDYFHKYKQEHKGNNSMVNIEQIKTQCERLQQFYIQNSFSQTITKTILSYLTILKNESEILAKCLYKGRLDQYVGETQIQYFLENIKLNSKKAANQGKQYGFYMYKK